MTFIVCNTHRDLKQVLLTWTSVSSAVEPPTLTGAETQEIQHNDFPVLFPPRVSLRNVNVVYMRILQSVSVFALF